MSLYILFMEQHFTSVTDTTNSLNCTGSAKILKVDVVRINKTSRYIYVKIKHPLAVNSPVLLFKPEDFKLIEKDLNAPNVKYIKMEKGKVLVRTIRDRLGTEWEIVRDLRKKKRTDLA